MATDTPDTPPTLRLPPTATDFPRVTTRFMIAARLRVREDLVAALAALRDAVGPMPDKIKVTRWVCTHGKPYGGTTVRPGTGSLRTYTVRGYADELHGWSRLLIEKGKGPAYTLGESRYGGRSDAECELRSGLLLDSDECGGWAARSLLRQIGLAYVGQQRPAKPSSCHLEIFFVRPLIPVRDAEGRVDTWKATVYCASIGWLMGVLSELLGLRYEPFFDASGHASAKYAGFDTACDQLLQLNFAYTRRPGDPAGVYPTTWYRPGGGLDLDALLAATGFDEARPMLAEPVRQVPSRSFVGATSRSCVRSATGTEPISMVTIWTRLLRLSRESSQALVAPLLDGRSYAPLGQRDATMARIAGVLAGIAPHGHPDDLAKVFEKSLRAMAREPGATPAFGYVELKLRLAAEKIARAQRGLR